MKQRLDVLLTARGFVSSRSQAESWIRLGKVTVDGRTVTKPGEFVAEDADIKLTAKERYVSRAGLKLASVAKMLGVDFKNKTVLDVGSSTGGFTDYALQHGARKVIAVDVGTDQMHPDLRSDERIDLHEKTDIRSLRLQNKERRTQKEEAELYSPFVVLRSVPDIILIDVSFISLRDILPYIHKLCAPGTLVLAMVKPQFEAGREQVSKGIIKNDAVRRQILKDFEAWVRRYFVVAGKRDSEVAGSKGNRERFYLLSKIL